MENIIGSVRQQQQQHSSIAAASAGSADRECGCIPRCVGVYTGFRSEVREILSRFGLDSNDLTEKVLHFMDTHYGRNSPLKRGLKTLRGLMAFSIWEILNQEGNPHDPRNIAYMCDVPYSKLCMWDKELDISPTFAHPFAYTSRLVCSLGLPRSIAVLVTKVIQGMDGLLYHPETICAAVLIELKLLLRAKKSMDFAKIDEKFICSTFGVSQKGVTKALPF